MHQLTAKDVMTSKVFVVRADWSVDRLSEFLVENSISGAPVESENGDLIGVVSLIDIVHHKTRHEKDPNWPHDYYLRALERQFAKEEIASFHIETEPLSTIKTIMTLMIFQVSENTPVPQIADMMIKNRIHRVMVTQDKKLVGIISTPDMLKVIRDA